MPDTAPLGPGDPASLGSYEIVGKLGEGGQGAVYLARTPEGEHVAIKLLHAQMTADSSARTRFAREVEAAQTVSPFCTARVLEYDLHGDRPYVVNEFIDGPSLYDVVAQKGPFAPHALERLAIGTVTALAAIHEAGIVHRDFKPNNVLLAKDGPRVVDFGIARSLNVEQSAVTATGMVVGTPGYLAPEQLSGEALSPAVDIFAWGATMMFAATGQSPFEAETLPVIINRILHEDPDLSVLSGHLHDLVRSALTKKATQRPAAHELLLQLLGQAGVAPAAPARQELLDKGTQLAAQMPAPPPVRPAQPSAAAHVAAPQAPRPHAPPATPNPPMHMGGPPRTPNPPMQMGAGPSTPNPPLQMGPPPSTPNPPLQMGAHPSPPQTAPRPMQAPPPYPPRQSGSGGRTAAIILASVGAGLVVILLIAIIAVAASKDEKNPTPTPTRSRPTLSFGVPAEYGGTWRGTGTNKSNNSTFNITITLTQGSYNGTVVYGSCSGTLFYYSSESTATKIVLSQIITQNGTGTNRCDVTGKVTLTQRTSTYLGYEYMPSGQTAATATGSVSKS